MTAPGSGGATRAKARLGKFNAGQKLNATFLGAAIFIMLGTGSIMKWFDPFPISWRTGATFVHDWVALGVWLAVIGHIMFALRDPDALAAMRRGPDQRALGAHTAAALVRGRDREVCGAAESRPVGSPRWPTPAATIPARSSSPPSCVRATAGSAPGRRRCAPRPSRASPTRRRRVPRHEPSPRRRPRRRAPGARGAHRAVLPARRVRDPARQRRHHVVLGRGGVRPDRAAQRAPGVRRVLVEVRGGRRGRAAPRGRRS